MSAALILSITALVGLYMAWNIGANDVANAMGTSVGSRALTLRQAIVVAGILEFAGAVLVGAYVSDTVRKGIVNPGIFAADPLLLVHGMMAALIAAALWLNLASFLGLPVSTTHAIVGAVAGFGILTGGMGAISWGTLGFITASWVVSPIVGGLVAFVLFSLVRRFILQNPDPGTTAQRSAPAMVAVLTSGLALVVLFKGLKNVDLNLQWYQSLSFAVGLGLFGATSVALYQRRGLIFGGSSSMSSTSTSSGSATLQITTNNNDDDTRAGVLDRVERTFQPLQVATAASVAFAHGANDVANAVGPMAAVFATIQTGLVTQKVDVPLWILVLGGAGIVIGLATYGFKVMATIGTKITEITPSRGFAAEFGAAMTILVGSKLGLPLSTTHTLVGAVVGVGIARGTAALNMTVVRNIAVSWLLTVPIAAAVTVPVFYLLRWLG